MSQEIGVRELKNRLTAIIREIRETGAEYTVTVHGQPVAVITPVSYADEGTRATAVVNELFGLKALAARMAAGKDTEPLRDALAQMREESPWR